MTELPTLDCCVLDALDLYISCGVPILNLPEFQRPLVLGSGNAAVTGKLLFSDKDAVFADESTYRQNWSLQKALMEQY